MPLATILVGRAPLSTIGYHSCWQGRFWKGGVSFKSARSMMVTDGRTELVSDKTVTRDAYASKKSWSICPKLSKSMKSLIGYLKAAEMCLTFTYIH